MSYYSYSGGGPIQFSTFDIWANNVSSDTGAGIDNALSDWYPAQSAPYKASTLLGADCFYATFYANTGGTISMTAPYSVGSTTAITSKNFDLGVYNPTVVASATYPYTFHSWRTGTNGGGSQITTSASLTITTSTTQSTAYYAYFTTTHVTP